MEIIEGDPLDTKKFSIFLIFEKKKQKNEKFELSRSAEILKKGDPLDFLAL